ncbi:ricin-type beta-trefoil lectin domain protein [Streptomyces sp. NPDC013012]|uniref:RICIN domain-containing protein n=1 Tax=Streptomyces sp. NPDC013012 TaxID=3364860 RepID=UPI0036C56606
MLGTSAVLLTGATGNASAAEVGPMAVGQQLKNARTGLCLDSDYKGNVYTKGCAGDHNNPYQQWIFQWPSNGKVKFENVQTGRCLQRSGWEGVITGSCDSSFAEWQEDYLGSQRYNFIADNGLALDSDAKGNAYLHVKNNGSANPYQQWWLW